MTQETSEPSLTLEELQQFFSARKGVLNVSPVGEEAGLSRSHLNKILRGEKKLTTATIEKLVPVLHKYGYNMPDASFLTTLTLEQLQSFLNERKPAINITHLAQELEMSRSHLNQIIKGISGFSAKTTVKLLLLLPKYGFRG